MMRAGWCAVAGMVLGLWLSGGMTGAAASRPADTQPRIARVYFVQHHVLAPDSPYFKLVGNLDTLIKVQACSAVPSLSPSVVARLKLGAETLELPLKGPRQLPKPPTGNPLLLEQKFDDSYTAIIPREWIAPGLDVTVELKEGTTRSLDSVVFHKLAIGAPTRLILTMFDFHFFGGDKGADYPKGWFEGLGARLPVAELELRRARNIMLDKLVMPPREGAPATLCGSKEEYQKKTKVKFDGEQAVTQMWNGALKEAAGAGAGGTRRLYYANIYGVWAGGQAGGLSGVGHGKSHGILLHELGHALSLPDLSEPGMKYPYCGPMHGVQAPGNSDTTYHVGPTWGFDLSQQVFISSRTSDGCFARDPMGGGGANKNGGPALYQYFSDYHFSRMRDCLEQTQMVRDERTGRYLQWDQRKGTYATVDRELGQPNCPVEDDIDVISVLASASPATPGASIVYPPIGPYKGGRLESFDAASSTGRSHARKCGYDESACFCLRVTQGNKVTTYLVKKGVKADGDPTDTEASMAVFAINLPARDGAITQVDLLHTPGVMRKGVKGDNTPLYTWKGSASAHGSEMATALYPARKESAKSDPKTGTRTTQKGTSAALPSRPTAPQTRQLAADRQTALDQELERTLVKLSDTKALNTDALRLSVSSKPIVLVTAETDGGLTIKAEGTERTAQIAWKTLTPADRMRLAILVAKLRPDSSTAQAMAGVYLEINGYASQAETYYQKAGPETRAGIDKLFE